MTGVAWAADHREAPIIQQDVSADINDIYAFISPNDSQKLVLIMTVNPFSAAPSNDTYHFSSDVRYSFLVSNNNDAIADRRVHVHFTERTAAGQNYNVRVSDDTRFSVTSWSGAVTQPTIKQQPNPPIIAQGALGIRSFAGQSDDPFFFDVVGFKRFLMGTGGFSGSDGFSGQNVSSIAIEMPVDLVAQGSSSLQIWGITERRETTIRRSDEGELVRSEGPWQQIERMGNPGVSTVFIPFGLKDQFNIALPENDNDFAPVIVESLMGLGTNEQNINILASVAIPDTLKLDLNQPSGFPNGRRLEDDVIDTLLFFIFNQNVTPDGVPENDKPFRANFPFVADPFQPG
jgi:hypothetical protein